MSDPACQFVAQFVVLDSQSLLVHLKTVTGQSDPYTRFALHEQEMARPTGG